MDPLVEPGSDFEMDERKPPAGKRSDFEMEDKYTGKSKSRPTCISCISNWLHRNPNIVFRSILIALVFLIFVLIAVRNGQDGLSREVSFRLTSLENTVGDLTQKFLEEKHRADKLFQQLTSLENTVGDLTQKFIEEKQRADQLIQQLEKSRVEHHSADVTDFADITQTNVATSVAFSAYLARDLDDLGPDQTVIFENVTLNDGNAYNPLLGTFHVPRAGLYFFTVTLQSFKTRRQWFTLVADRQMQTELLFYPSGHQMATNTALLRLNEGQTVRVAASEKGVSLQNGYTSKFSGFFLNE